MIKYSMVLFTLISCLSNTIVCGQISLKSIVQSVGGRNIGNSTFSSNITVGQSSPISGIGSSNFHIANGYINTIPNAFRTINLLFPNGAEILFSGTEREIKWNSSNIDTVKLEYSTNNGLEWLTISDKLVANLSKYKWAIPSIGSKNCIVQISDVRYSHIRDTSDSEFEIFKYPETVQLSYEIDFGDYKESTSYKIIGLPVS
jgi:hypothetical protein